MTNERNAATGQENIGILGTGWLGFPLAEALARAGYAVRGTYRTEAGKARLLEAGLDAYHANLPGELDAGFLVGLSTLVITLPPGGRRLGLEAETNYAEKFRVLLAALPSPPPHLIYTSSSGVYGAARGWVDETTPPEPTTPSGRAVLAAERLLAATKAPVTILRLAGLIGPGRHPGRFFGGRDRAVPRGLAPVNLVSRQDVIRAVRLVVRRAAADGETRVFNVCADAHPPKGPFYAAAAKKLGLVVKNYEAAGEGDKRLNSKQLRLLGWRPTRDDLRLDGV